MAGTTASLGAEGGGGAADGAAHVDRDSDRLVFDVLAAALLLLCGVGGAHAALFAFRAQGEGAAGGGDAGGAAAGAGRGPRRGAAVSLFTLGVCVSGGVMLGAGFCHLLGDASRGLWARSGPGGYPTAELLAAVGFLVTLLADQAAGAAAARAADGAGGGGRVARWRRGEGDPLALDVELSSPTGAAEAAAAGDGGGGGGLGLGLGLGAPASPPSGGSARPSARASQATEASAAAGGDVRSLRAAVLASSSAAAPASASSLVLALALSVHSVLEGAAMGAQPSLESSFDVFLAVVAHKALASYALGTALLEANVSVAAFRRVVWTFASATPLGIFLGLAVSELGRGAERGETSATSEGLSALASGTFVYVAVVEVIPRELGDPRDPAKPRKLAALLAGFAAMSLVARWV